MIKTLSYFFEACLLYTVYGIFKCLPVTTASNLGAWLGRTIGPHMGASKKALNNLHRVFPDKTQAQRHAIMIKMWDHFGRVFAEYAHIRTIAQTRTQIINPQRLDAYKTDGAAMFIGGHLGNWELGCAAVYLQHGIKIGSAYRPPNNPWADKLLLKSRTLNNTLPSYSKSRTGGRAMIKAAKNKQSIVFMIDQKYNEGINAPFFNHDAMTNPAFVEIAQKFDLDLVPVYLIRDDGVQFTLHVEDKIPLKNADGTNRPVIDVINDAHKSLEHWITKHPEQWLWLHRRWKTD